MTITQYIAQLEKIYKIHGDLEIAYKIETSNPDQVFFTTLDEQKQFNQIDIELFYPTDLLKQVFDIKGKIMLLHAISLHEKNDILQGQDWRNFEGCDL